MRTLAELEPVRASLDSKLAWVLLQALRSEQESVGIGSSFRRSIFTLSWSVDLPPSRIHPLVQELVDADAIDAELQPDGRMYELEVL